MAAVQKQFAVALDIKRPTTNRDFEVVEGDTGNVLEIELTDDGAAIDLTGCRVLAVFSSSKGAAQQDTDGNGVALDPEQSNKLTISLYAASVAPGLVECELQVYSGENFAVLATSAKFNFMCRRGIANGDVLQATEEWPLLVNTLKKVETAQSELELLTQTVDDTMGDLTQDVTNALASLNSLTTAAAELADGAARHADTAAGNANTAADTANAAADAAYAAAENRGNAVDAANVAVAQTIEATEYAQAKGDYAKAMGEAAEAIVNSGTTWDTLPGKPTAFTPISHSHGNMTNDGKIGTAASLPVFTGDGGKLETKDAASARNALDAAKKPVALSVTLSASGWSGGQQTISNAGIPAQSGGDIYPAPSATDAEYTAFLGAQIRTIAQAAGSLTVKALGTVPAIDIPAEIEVRV